MNKAHRRINHKKSFIYEYKKLIYVFHLLQEIYKKILALPKNRIINHT